MSNPNFARGINPLTVDPETTEGWNKREYSWDITAGVTQQIAPRVSLEVDYIRRTWGNLKTTVNNALTADDFDTFVFNVPSDPKLPGGGGYPLTFRDVKPAKFGIYQQLPDFHEQHRRILQHLQRRRRQRERAPARRDHPGWDQHRQRGRG